MDKVQVANILFFLMAIVLFITLLIAFFPRKKNKTFEKAMTHETLKENYEKALKKGDSKEIVEEGRKYYANLRNQTKNDATTESITNG